MYMSVRPFVPEVSLQYQMTDDLLFFTVNKSHESVSGANRHTIILHWNQINETALAPPMTPYFFLLCLFSSLNAH